MISGLALGDKVKSWMDVTVCGQSEKVDVKSGVEGAFVLLVHYTHAFLK